MLSSNAMLSVPASSRREAFESEDIKWLHHVHLFV